MRVLVSMQILAAAVGFRASAGDDQAKAIVDKAIKAIGGEEKLAPFKAFTSKSEGKMFGPDFDFVEEGVSQLPDRYRFDMDLTLNTAKIKQVIVFNGPKGWNKIANTKPMEFPKPIAAAFQDYFYGLRLTLFPNGLKHKDITLSLVGDVTVGDQAAVAVRAAAKGKIDVTIAFDKKTSLPIRLELNALDAIAEKEVLHEFLFSKHKEMEGIQFPTEMVWNKDGKKFMTREFKEVRPLDKVDAGLFAEP